MKPKFVKCEFCKTEIQSEVCELAAYPTTIEGKQYIFCCAACAKRHAVGKTEKE